MELDILKDNTTWNDASASINNNFAKVKTAIEQGGGSGSLTIDTAMSETSENAVQNKVIKKYVDQRAQQAYDQALEYTDEELTAKSNALREYIDEKVATGGGSINPTILEDYTPLLREFSDEFNNDFTS